MAHQAFSNLTSIIQDMVAEDEKVAARILAQGKHTGAYIGIKPTGNQVKFNGMVIRRIVGGQVIEEWQTFESICLKSNMPAYEALNLFFCSFSSLSIFSLSTCIG